MKEFENIYNITVNKIKKEYEEFKTDMLSKSAREVMNSAYRIYMFAEFFGFFTMCAEQLDEYFVDYQREFMRKNKIKIMEYIKENNMLEKLYWFFCDLEELEAPTYDNIAWAFIEVLDGGI